MKTRPNLSLEEHINNLASHLQRYFPEIKSELFLFFKAEDCVRKNKKFLLQRSNLMDYQRFQILFKELCTEGREWINLSGDSWLGNHFLIMIDFSRAVGEAETSILIGGPVFDIEHKPILKTDVLLID